MTHDPIIVALVEHIVATQPTDYSAETLPRDQSLFELRVLDSFGVLSLVTFIEQTWALEISDDEITAENFSTVESVAGLIDRLQGMRS